MNVILEVIKAVVLFVEGQEFQMLTIARNALNKKKIEMDAQRLLIQVLLKLIFSMSGRNMDLKKGDNMYNFKFVNKFAFNHETKTCSF